MEVRALTRAESDGQRVHLDVVRAMVLLKKAAALANQQVGLLPGQMAAAIVSAADEILLGVHGLERLAADRMLAGCGLQQDRLVTGALAERAAVLLSNGRDEHPPAILSDHIDLSQSPEDTVTMATRLAVLSGWHSLRGGLSAFAHVGIAETWATLDRAAEQLLGHGLCSFASGADMAPGFREALLEQMQVLTGWKPLEAPDRPVSCRDTGDLVRFSEALRGLAAELGRAAKAARLTGTEESKDLHGAQRMVERAALAVAGNDLVVSLSCMCDDADLDLFTAVLGHVLPSGLALLNGVVRAWADVCAQVPRELERRQGPVASSTITASTPAAAGEASDRRQALAFGEHRVATQLKVLNELAVILNSERDAGRMLDQVLRGAAQLTGARSGSLYLLEPGGLRLEAFTTSAGVVGKNGPQPPPGVEARDLARRVVQDRRLARLAQDMPGRPGRFLGYLAAPLVALDGEVLGSFVLTGAPDEAGFSAEDEMLAQTLAAHVAVALQNMHRLEHEQQVAEYLQRSMLPRIPRIPGLELDVTYQSAFDTALVGGDFYDVIDLGRRHVALAVGDVCGKGLVAATQMTMVRHMLRAHASPDVEPGRWLSLVNDSMERNLIGAEFVTVALVVVDASTGILDYAMAGHAPPLLAARRGTWDLSGEPGLPLGVKRGAEYKSHRAFMPREATLFLYTDGLYEARVGGRLFGAERLHLVAHELGAAAVKGGPGRLVEEARAFAGGRLADDVVVLEARITTV